jgi:hypothetical protein
MTKEISTIVGTGGSPATNTHPWINGHGLELDPRGTPINEIRSGLRRVYQVHFVPHSIFHYDLLRVNHLQTGLIGFQQVGQVAGSNPFWGNNAGGLTISVSRPQGVPDGTLGHFASVNLNGTLFDAPGGPFPTHGRFLVCGTFRRPVQLALSGFVPGDFAAAVLLQTGEDRPRGATCQFKTTGSRLNLPGTGTMLDRTPSKPLQERIMNPTNPPTFTVILGYDRSRTPNGFAALLVDQEIVDSAPFDFAALDGITKIDKILMGVGTATGAQYTAKIDLIDLQIWVPPHPVWW